MFADLRALYTVMHDVRRSRAELSAVKDARLRRVLTSAFLHVPYYRDLMMAAQYDPRRDFQSIDDLKRLPILTKATIRQQGERSLLREDVDAADLFRDATSGSTGQPLQVWRSEHARSLQVARWLRVLLCNGYRLTDKVLSFTSPARLGEGRSVVQHLGLLQRRPVDYLLPAEKLLDETLAYGPDVVYGNRSQIDLLASELLRRGCRLPQLKFVAVGAEVIREHHRRLYERAFGVPIVEFYGSVELGVIAWQMPSRDALDVCEDQLHVEFVNERGQPAEPGERCRAIVTDLANDAMPFLRYDQGDWIRLAPLSPGDTRGWRCVSNIEGRDDDFAILPNGRRIPFHPFYEVMDRFLAIRQFRVIQRSRSQFEIVIAADPAYFDAIVDEIETALARQFPPDVFFDVRRVENIEPDPSGKLRMLVSEAV